jgi:hypothetical protein
MSQEREAMTGAEWLTGAPAGAIATSRKSSPFLIKGKVR